MRGIPEFNFPEFARVAGLLRAAGYEVFSPHERDIERSGFDISKGNTTGDEKLLPAGVTSRVCLRDDCVWICDNAEGIALLDGWGGSKGAKAEIALGDAIGIKSKPYSDWVVRAPARLNKKTALQLHAPPAGVTSRVCLKDDFSETPRCRLLPADTEGRKACPIASGVVDYFPDALTAIAQVSKAGNDKHNPGQPMHHARGKSMDHADCIMRHLIERGTLDSEDGLRHSAKLAWRALALLQGELERELSLPLPRGAAA